MLYTPGKTEITPSEVGYDEGRIETLNNHFQSIIDDGKIQCAMYCLTRHGKVFAHGAVGKKSYRADDNTPASPDNVRWYASITKVMTATAIMKLVEDGHIQLNTNVAEILPQFDTPPFNFINLLHLLTHTSGLHADGGCFPNKYQHSYWSLISAMFDRHDKEKDGEFDWITAALSTIGSGVRTKPGEEWAYCSFGFMILGAVIEKLTGLHSHDYIMQNIISPLGMKDTCFDITPDLARRMIVDNERSEKWINDMINGTTTPDKWDKLKLPGTSGALNGTAYDLTRFGNMFLNGGNLDGVRILGRKTVEKMTSKQIHDLPSYTWGANGTLRSACAGFELRTDQPFIVSPSTFSHEGAGAASLYIDPEEDMVAAWIVPYTDHREWISKALFNALNVIWSGLK